MNKTVPDTRYRDYSRIESHVTFRWPDDAPFEAMVIFRHGEESKHIHITQATVRWNFNREMQDWELQGVDLQWNPTKRDGSRSLAKRNDYFGAISAGHYLPEIIRAALPSINVTTTEASA